MGVIHSRLKKKAGKIRDYKTSGLLSERSADFNELRNLGSLEDLHDSGRYEVVPSTESAPVSSIYKSTEDSTTGWPKMDLRLSRSADAVQLRPRSPTQNNNRKCTVRKRGSCLVMNTSTSTALETSGDHVGSCYTNYYPSSYPSDDHYQA